MTKKISDAAVKTVTNDVGPERTVDFYLQFNNERGLKQAARLLMRQEEGLKYTEALRRVKTRLNALSEGS